MKKKLSLNRETIRNLDPTDLGNVHGGTGDTHIPECANDTCSCAPYLCIPTDCNEFTCHCNNTVRICINTYAPVC